MPPLTLQSRPSSDAGRRRLLLYAYGGCFPLMLLLGSASIAAGRVDLAGVAAVCTTVAAIGFRKVKAGVHLTPAAIGLLFTAASMAMLAVVMSGGALSGAISWLFLLPPLAGLLLGMRGATIVAAIVGTFFLGLIGAHMSIGNWRDIETIDKAARLAAVSHTLALALMFSLTRVTGKVLDSSRESLESARDEARDANAIKGQFLANMSHEIRTPINGILGMVDQIKDEEDPAVRAEALGIVEMCARTMMGHVNGILDLSRLSSGEIEIQEGDFELEPLVEGVLHDALAQVAHSELGPRDAVLCESMIDPACPRVLVGDARRIGQLLTALVVNGLRFTTEGEVVLEVQWDGERREVIFRVNDTGEGIPEEALDHIFENFTQVDSSLTREHGGLGIGLAIVRELVEAMNGSVTNCSEVGVGSTFEVRLPLVGSASSQSEEEGLSGLAVCVVEPRDSARRALEAAVQASGGRLVRRDSVRDAQVMLHSGGLSPLEERALSGQYGPVFHMESPISRARLRENLRSVVERKGREDRIKPRVLLVEDTPTNAKIAMRLVKSFGYECDLTENGEEAIQALERSVYSCVLMDCQMPLLDGYEATRQIRGSGKAYSDVPILALTAHALEGDRDRCLEAGMDGYLTKPIHKGQLQRALDEVHMKRAA